MRRAIEKEVKKLMLKELEEESRELFKDLSHIR